MNDRDNYKPQSRPRSRYQDRIAARPSNGPRNQGRKFPPLKRPFKPVSKPPAGPKYPPPLDPTIRTKARFKGTIHRLARLVHQRAAILRFCSTDALYAIANRLPFGEHNRRGDARRLVHKIARLRGDPMQIEPDQAKGGR